MTEDTLKPYVIGLDLGGTNSVFGIVDSRGEIKATTAIKTQGYGDNVNAYVDAAVNALQTAFTTAIPCRILWILTVFVRWCASRIARSCTMCCVIPTILPWATS